MAKFKTGDKVMVSSNLPEEYEKVIEEMIREKLH